MRPDPLSNLQASPSVVSRTRAGFSRLLCSVMLALFGLVALSASASALTIHVKLGSAYQGCRGFGICSIWVTRAGLQGHPADAVLRNDKLVVTFSEKLPEQSDVLPIDVPFEIDAETARGLEVPGLVVLPGRYPVDYSNNPNGQVVLEVRRTGIVVNVEVGRRSKGCHGFGICSITVGTDHASATDRIVGSVATLDGETLHLEFGDRLPEQGDSLRIDENIVLDAATARKNGLKWCEVLSGTYYVDYSNNPNGSVDLNVKRIGISIEIEAGRKSRDCHGFGICSITIGWSYERLSQQSVRSVASVNGELLDVEFGESLPERGDSLVIDEPIELDPTIAHAFGAERAVVAKGTYHVDYSDNPNGTVSLNVQRFGIVIEVEVGRSSKGCRGFGICSITIGADFTERMVPAVGSLEGNRLRLRFASKLPEQGDVLTIDEPITLDGRVAKAIGAGEMTILPGEYRVVYGSDGTSHVDVSVLRHTVGLQVKIGRKSQDCWNFGLCAVRLADDINADARTISAFSSLQGSTLTLAFGSKAPDAGDVLTIDEAIMLDEETAKALGSSELTILPGRYHVDYRDNPHGTVQLRTQRIGITIGIDVGRRSKDCNGLGICSITIGLDFSARTVPTIGSIENGRLHLVFGKDLPEQGAEFVIEEDIVLSREHARGLGHGDVTLKRGTYRIVTDRNGEQSVDIDIAARGITVTIHIGRRGCERGFGICRITVERSYTERAVMAVAVMEEGKLRLDFLGETLDREEMMVFEENFELSTEVMIALGLDPEKKHMIRKGAYAMDSSDNEYGTLELETGIQSGSASVKSQSSGFTMTSSAAPNPTSGVTAIRFTLPQASLVTVTVVDAQGRPVLRPLENSMMGAGEQSIGVDAGSLSAGAYHYTIDTPSGRSAGTLVVVK